MNIKTDKHWRDVLKDDKSGELYVMVYNLRFNLNGFHSVSDGLLAHDWHDGLALQVQKTSEGLKYKAIVDVDLAQAAS